MSNTIEVRGLTYRAGKTFAIRELDLSVPIGAIYGFLGPNGAGKTTTIRLLMGMTRPLAGEIRLLGHAVPQEVARALARTGYVPERPHLYPELTVEEAMRCHAAFFTSWDAAWASNLKRKFGLPLDRKIRRLSKGEIGKLLIMLALGQRPELLVLDEPTDGLDPMVRSEVLAAILDYVAETGSTVFISSHLVHELERICDWVAVMDHGRVTAELPIQSFVNGVKRIRLEAAPAEPGDTPFVLLTRVADPFTLTETWVVRGWREAMRQYFEGVGATIRDVIDLDLEEVFVELLRASRQDQR